MMLDSEKDIASKPTHYYVPDSSPWPLVGAFFLFVTVIGAANVIQSRSGSGLVPNEGALNFLLPLGVLGIFFMMFMWFRDTIIESLQNRNSVQMSVSYKQGMIWFIFSEVMFFAVLFGALFYARWLSIPWLGGEGKGAMTHEVLWPSFQANWPLVVTPSGERVTAFGAWGLPLINTVILIISSLTLSVAHHALEKGNRKKQAIFIAITFSLGLIFLGLQAYEYRHAYQDLNLTLSSGYYGSIFYIMTGFHGLHVTIGTIMLIVMFLRTLKGHLTPDNHFAFTATAWYWHFVDVVWVILFIAVYWL